MTEFEKRVRKAFCRGCPMYARGEPKDCLAYFEGISEDEICHIIWEPERFARGARRFVKMETKERDFRRSAAKHILAIKPVKDKKICEMLKLVADREII